MPKKSTKHKKTKDRSLRLTFIIVGSFLLFLGLGVGLQLVNKSLPAFCANSISCIEDLTGQKQPDNTGEFMGKKVVAPDIEGSSLYALNVTQNVLGEATNDNKHIYVDLTNQRLTAYDGSTKVFDFPVSTGKWGPTPTGDFHIWIWLKYTRMSGGTGNDYYNLPNVPYTMFFYNSDVSKGRGYSLHGAYWHNNFGHPMSHGCVNMRIEDAGKIFTWSNPGAISQNTTYPTEENPGTLITIYGSPPEE